MEISGLLEPEEPEPEEPEDSEPEPVEPEPELEPPLGTTGHWHISSPEGEEPTGLEPLEEPVELVGQGEPAGQDSIGLVEPVDGVEGVEAVGHGEPAGQTVSVEPVG